MKESPLDRYIREAIEHDRIRRQRLGLPTVSNEGKRYFFLGGLTDPDPKQVELMLRREHNVNG